MELGRFKHPPQLHEVVACHALSSSKAGQEVIFFFVHVVHQLLAAAGTTEHSQNAQPVIFNEFDAGPSTGVEADPETKDS
jgi:hypothetical protein